MSVLLLGAATCGALTVDIPPLGTERPADGEASVDARGAPFTDGYHYKVVATVLEY